MENEQKPRKSKLTADEKVKHGKKIVSHMKEIADTLVEIWAKES